MDTVKIDKNATRMIAHRGLSGIEPENTNAAFIAAGNRSYFGIETDVHRTADGKFVVIHDDTTGRVCEEDLSVENSLFDELRALHIHGTNGEATRPELGIPTLKEYIATCKRYGKTAVLELKNEFSEEDIKAICDEIDEVQYSDGMIFISFCFENLVKLRALRPNATVQFLTGKYTPDLPEKLKEHGFGIDIYHRELNEENVKALRDAGIAINCWTVDEKADAERLIGLGADFITTDILE